MTKIKSIWLKKWRQRLGWTQKAAAVALCIGERTLKGYEYGSPCKESVIAFAKQIETEQKEGK